MPLPIPELDDRTYADLVAEALDLIPLVAPGWTDRNPGDPGIALVELLAWATEMMIFRLDRPTDDHTRAFLALLHERDWTPGSDDLAGTVRSSLRSLHGPQRAVTAGDYEHLARAAAGDRARRVHCLPGWDVSGPAPREADGHVTVLLVTGSPLQPPDPALVADVDTRLREARLLGSRHHVAGPGHVDLTITATLALVDGADPDLALDRAARRLLGHLDPLPGDGRAGWGLGHPVHATGIEAVLEDVETVDYVDSVGLYRRGDGTPRTSVTPAPYELVGSVGVTLTGYDVRGRSYVHTAAGPS